MESIKDQNYYEILELPYTATPAEIQTHYLLAKKTYAENGLGGYSLFDDRAQKEILEKIEEAYFVLIDPQKKEQYDQSIAATTPVPVDSVATVMPEATLQDTVVPSDLMTGEQIKWFREKKGITLEEIAETTRININYLSSIEANRFDFLPAEVYVYSYLRQIVKVIQCQDNGIIEQYMKEYRIRRASSRK